MQGGDFFEQSPQALDARPHGRVHDARSEWNAAAVLPLTPATAATGLFHRYVRSLGVHAAFDYRSRTASAEIIDALGGSPLAGTLAIGSGSLPPTLKIAAAAPGSRRIASANPGPIEPIQVRRKRIQLSLIWGGTLKGNEVGPAIYADLLPAALAAGTYRAAPEAELTRGVMAIASVMRERARRARPAPPARCQAR
jgi:hypothetical protein